MKRKKIVVALGHKALGTTLPEQKAAVKRSAKVIADLVAAGADVVITHSNAPQVGMIHMAMNEFGKMHTDYSAAPMSVCSAMSEGYIGYDLQNALREAGIAPEAVGHINAHATSTQLNDSTETKAIKLVFGEHAGKIKISATKSMTGHMLGAAGAVEAIFTALSLRDGFLPATIHYQVPDPACDLDVVPNQGRPADIRYALSNSLGFGGHNGSLLLKKWED